MTRIWRRRATAKQFADGKCLFFLVVPGCVISTFFISILPFDTLSAEAPISSLPYNAKIACEGSPGARGRLSACPAIAAGVSKIGVSKIVLSGAQLNVQLQNTHDGY